MPRAAFDMTFEMKANFLDTAKVRRLVDEANRKALMRAGGLVRTIARRSMRYVTDPGEQARQVAGGERKRITQVKSSLPGQPPHAIRPHPWIRDNLLFAFDPASFSVVAGPVGFPTGSGAPAILEYGGSARIRNRRRIRRRIGSGGEIRIGADAARFRCAKPNADGVPVVYVRLTTARQVDRANALNEQLYGPMYQVKTIAARPYMGPALEKASPDVPALWAGSVSA